MIPQSRYVDINSNVLGAEGSAPANAGLIITSTEMLSGASVKSTYDSGTPVLCTYAEVCDYFGPTSNEAKFAEKYFGYISPEGDSPSGLYVAKKLSTDDSYAAVITRLSTGTIDFRTFTVLDSTLTPANIKAVADASLAIDGKPYRFCFATTDSTQFYDTGASGWDGVNMANYAETTCVEVDSGYLNDVAVTMAIAAAIDYNLTGAACTQFARQMPGASAHVTSGPAANTLDQHNINYFGQTKGNGGAIVFYQKGVNLDGVDTSVTDNEAWLKKTIAGKLISLMVASNKIPANGDGASMIQGILIETAVKAVENGVITPKNLSSAQKSIVRNLAGTEVAVTEVESVGYYCAVNIVYQNNQYEAHYRLIYAKGDAVRKIEGVNSLA